MGHLSTGPHLALQGYDEKWSGFIYRFELGEMRDGDGKLTSSQHELMKGMIVDNKTIVIKWKLIFYIFLKYDDIFLSNHLLILSVKS